MASKYTQRGRARHQEWEPHLINGGHFHFFVHLIVVFDGQSLLTSNIARACYEQLRARVDEHFVGVRLAHLSRVAASI